MNDALTVERIDVLVGPTLDCLWDPWIRKNESPNKANHSSKQLECFRFYGKDDQLIEILESAFELKLIRIDLIDEEVGEHRHETFIVTLACGSIRFEGRYNTTTRKGEFVRK